MTNKAKRNLTLVVVILGVITLIGMAIGRIFYDIHYATWQYLAPPIWICFALTVKKFEK